MTIRTRRAAGSPAPRGVAPEPRLDDPTAVSAALEAWFPVACRRLPWRDARSGYGALVSEIMLQQTQVSRVVDAFSRFVARFPGVRALASAPESEVVASWQGLGYYRRARLLHAAAKEIAERHGGEVPCDAVALEALPGVGRYTAGAIASIVHGQRVPIVDGNVLRVLSRLCGRRTTTADPGDMRWAWSEAARLVEAASSPGTTNEALMELGATVCVPGSPRCAECPLAKACAARSLGIADTIPSPRRPATRRVLRWHALVDADEAGLLLERRPPGGLWGSMLQPPTVEAERWMRPAGLARVWGAPVREAGRFTHSTSHRQVDFRVFVRAGVQAPSWPGAGRVPLPELEGQPMSNAAWRAIEAAGVAVRTPPSASPGRAARTARSGS